MDYKEATTMSKTTTGTTPVLARKDAERMSIGKAPLGAELFVLRSGKLRHEGRLVARQPGGHGGYGITLVYTGTDGKEQSYNTFAGAATMVYLPASTPAAEAATEAAPAAEGSAKAMASKTNSKTSTTSKTEEPLTDLLLILLGQLQAEGIRPVVRWSPTKKYASLLVEGKPVGQVFKQTSSGLKVKAAVTLKELGAAKKGWKDNSHESNPYTVLGFFTEKELGKATAALVMAAARQAEERAAKKAAKAPAKKTAPARKTSAAKKTAAKKTAARKTTGRKTSAAKKTAAPRKRTSARKAR